MIFKYLTVDNELLLREVIAENPKAQRIFYEQYAPMLLGVCRRYLRSEDEAEDALMIGMVKIFRQCHTVQDPTSFVPWMKRVVTNECLMILRKHQVRFDLNASMIAEPAVPPDILPQLSSEHLLSLIDALPDGYRTIFNLYVVEGYKHHEIADMLSISVNTSKSQLLMARRKLQSLIASDYPQHQRQSQS